MSKFRICNCDICGEQIKYGRIYYLKGHLTYRDGKSRTKLDICGNCIDAMKKMIIKKRGGK